MSSIVRTYEQEREYIEQVSPHKFIIKKGFVPNMNVRELAACVDAAMLMRFLQVEGAFYLNSELQELVFDELKQHCEARGHGGFLPAVKQIANVAALPGIVGVRARARARMCACHCGARHNPLIFVLVSCASGPLACRTATAAMASPLATWLHVRSAPARANAAHALTPLPLCCAVDMENPAAVVSPGGVGFDINCGVRLLRTNLSEKDVLPVKEQLTQALFDHIPVGVGSRGIIPTTAKDLDAALVGHACARGAARHMHALSRSRCLAAVRWSRRWAWTGRCARATRGRRTRSTARSLGAC